jgi:hypothetical protein
MSFPLQCACGKQVIASEGMAGAAITCVCGRQLAVPSLGELRRRAAGFDLEAAAPAPGLFPDEVRPVPASIVYLLIFAWLSIGGLFSVWLSWVMGGPLAAGGALLVVAGQCWLFSLIYAGNPGAALVVLLMPIVGTLLAVQFIIDHWPLARWPALCQIGGSLLWLGGLVSR